MGQASLYLERALAHGLARVARGAAAGRAGGVGLGRRGRGHEVARVAERRLQPDRLLELLHALHQLLVVLDQLLDLGSGMLENVVKLYILITYL